MAAFNSYSRSWCGMDKMETECKGCMDNHHILDIYLCLSMPQVQSLITRIKQTGVQRQPWQFASISSDSQDEIHPPNSSVNKVNAEEMQDQAPENIIRKRPINRSKVSNRITYRRERKRRTNLSCETVTAESSPSPPANRAFFPLELGLFSFPVEFVCMRKLAVRTNWPTAAQKPLRKALNGYFSFRAYVSPSITTKPNQQQPVERIESQVRQKQQRETYKIPSQNTIQKLHHRYHSQEAHESIQEHSPLRCRREILLQDILGDFNRIGICFESSWARGQRLGRGGCWRGCRCVSFRSHCGGGSESWSCGSCVARGLRNWFRNVDSLKQRGFRVSRVTGWDRNWAKGIEEGSSEVELMLMLAWSYSVQYRRSSRDWG